MARVTNVVLYAVSDGARRALRSLDAADVANRGVAAGRLMAAISAECAEADRSGRPHPDFICVEETREAAPESKILSYTHFQEIDVFSLSPLVQGGGVDDLDALFAAREAAKKEKVK